MRRVRMLGLCLFAAMAVAAVVSASAFAGAEFGKCEAKAGGKYSDSNCTVKAKKGTGAYEWRKGSELPAVKFTGASEGEAAGGYGFGGVLWADFDTCSVGEWGLMTRKACEEREGFGSHSNDEKGKRETGVGVGIGCEAENSTGETVGKSDIEHVRVTFTGCLALGAFPCQNAGPEEIKTEELKGKLGYINKAGHEAGILLEPVHGKVFATFSCPEIEQHIVVGVGSEKEGAEYTSSGCFGECPGTTPGEEKHGGYHGIISPVKPVNKMTSNFTQEYKIEDVSSGEYAETFLNIPRAFEKKHVDELETYLEYEATGEKTMWSSAGEEITNVNTLQPAGEEAEIKA